ncbi:MAG: malate synthase A, partial [Terriglobales bacterium]
MTILNDAAETQTPTPAETNILTPEARVFLSKLAGRFEARRQELLARRRDVQGEIDHGKLPDFLAETAAIREGDWKVAPIPNDLLDRRVEITG